VDVVVGTGAVVVVVVVVATVVGAALLVVVVLEAELDVVVDCPEEGFVDSFGVVEHEARTSTAELRTPAISRPVRTRTGPDPESLRS
jgi:hypothetical protein